MEADVSKKCLKVENSQITVLYLADKSHSTVQYVF